MDIGTSIKYLAVDSDIKVADSEAAVWAERGIYMERVDTMTEAIDKLITGDYLYVGINSDAVDFMPLLKTMRSVTNAPLLIVTSNFDTQTEVAALGNGADLYARWHNTANDNIDSVLAHISRITERHSKEKRSLSKVWVHKKLIIAPENCVFVGNERIDVTPMEYRILYHLRVNRGAVLAYENMLRYIWGNDYENASVGQLQTHIKRLRKKLNAAPFGGDYIMNVHGVGYRFALDANKKR